jgi:Protein of unknown function (DUF3431)
MSISHDDRLVVLSHYNEDLSWLPAVNVPILLYSRTLPTAAHFVPHNKGREAYCYLHFIGRYYDELPGEIGFFHAHRHSDHQDLPADVIINNYRWGHFGYMNVNRDDWYNILNGHATCVTEYGWVREFWKEFSEPYLGTLPRELGFHPCAQFFVTRERIRQRPREFYVKSLEWLLHTPLECAISARVFEYLWHIIMGQPNPEPRRTRADYLMPI